MKVLITGGQGFIGRHTVELLVARGHEPLIFDRAHTTDFQHQFFMGDVRDADAVTEAMAHAEGFVHLAGVLGTQETIQNPSPAATTNVLGGLNVLQAAAQYDLPGVNIAVGNHWMNNTYSITKSTAERFVEMYRVERGLRALSVRAFNAYGPRQSIAAPFGPSKVRKIMPSFICRALTGEPIEIYGDGEQIMDMIFVTDVAVALVDSLEAMASGFSIEGDIVEAGTGRPTSVNQIAQVVSETVGYQTGVEVPITHIPMRPGEPTGSVVMAEVPYRYDHSIDLEEGTERTVAWFHDAWWPTWNR